MIFLEINPNTNEYEPVENNLNDPKLFHVIHGRFGTYSLYPHFELKINKGEHFDEHILDFTTVVDTKKGYLLYLKFRRNETMMCNDAMESHLESFNTFVKNTIDNAKSIRSFGFKRNGIRIKGIDFSFKKRRIPSDDSINEIMKQATFGMGY